MKAYHRNESARMFESNFFEFFSKVHPATPFILYIPVGLFILGSALYSGTTTWAYAAAFLPLGYLTWQLMEYFIHKELFHWEGNGPFTRRMHEILHGYHHKYPDDGTRLVMPLGASMPLALIIAGGLWFFHAPQYTVPYWVGLLFGYLWYDFTHWSTHFRKPLTEWGRQMRSHHMAHHFADPTKNYGISHRWIDRLMGSLKVREARADEND